MDGSVVLVTGAGSGLGAAIAQRMAADGAVVVVNDVDADAAEKTAADVGGRAVVFDVADPAAFTSGVDDVVAEHGHIDVLVNNAGVVNHRQDVVERSLAAQMARMNGEPTEPIAATSTLTDEQWDRAMKIHLYGTFHGTRAALRHMEPARAGAIVNLASIYGLGPGPGNAEYAAAKHGIVGFTRSVGVEVAPLGIRVNAVAPGFIDTPLLAPFDELFRSVLVARAGAGRLGRAEEVAEMVRFLAGPEASYCFGEVLTLSGAFG